SLHHQYLHSFPTRRSSDLDLAYILGIAAVIITLAFFGYITFWGGHTVPEKKRLGVIFWLFILEAIFWSGFEQAGSSLNLFAERRSEEHTSELPSRFDLVCR